MDPIEAWSDAYDRMKEAIEHFDAHRGTPGERLARRDLDEAIQSYNDASGPESLPDA